MDILHGGWSGSSGLGQDTGDDHEVVPPGSRFDLYVGREVCTFRNPKCGECVLRAEALCPGLALTP